MHIVPGKKRTGNMREIAAITWGRLSVKIGYGTFLLIRNDIIMVIRIQHKHNERNS